MKAQSVSFHVDPSQFDETFAILGGDVDRRPEDGRALTLVLGQRDTGKIVTITVWNSAETTPAANELIAQQGTFDRLAVREVEADTGLFDTVLMRLPARGANVSVADSYRTEQIFQYVEDWVWHQICTQRERP
jgi:hypothetical protein